MALAASNVSFAYHRGAPVLRGVSADFPAGSLTAILGPNGSGKTTLLRLLLGLLAPRDGEVTLAGRAVRAMTEPQRAARLAYVPQRPSVAFGFTTLDIVALGAGRFPAKQAQAAARSALESVGLTDRARTPFAELSAGQQQRAVLARALAQLRAAPTEGPAAILADEPASAMDPRHALEAMAILRAEAAAGRAVVVVLHDLSAAARFADRALLLDSGGVVAGAGPTSEALNLPTLRRVFDAEFVQLADESGGLRAFLPSIPAPSR